jgi:hypothetical protein
MLKRRPIGFDRSHASGVAQRTSGTLCNEKQQSGREYCTLERYLRIGGLTAPVKGHSLNVSDYFVDNFRGDRKAD